MKELLPIDTIRSLSWEKAWNVFGWGAAFFIFYLPFSMALNLAPEFDVSSSRLGVAAFFLAWLVLSAVLGKRIFVSTPAGFGLVAILAIGALSLLFAKELGWGLRKLLLFASVFPFFYVMAGVARQKKWQRRLINFLLAAAVAVSLLGIVQFFAQFAVGFEPLASLYAKKIGPMFWGQSFSALVEQSPSWLVNVSGRTLMRGFALFPDPHMMAFFLGLSLPFALSRFLFEQKNKALSAGIFGLLALGILITFSRGGYLGLAAALLSVLALGWKFLAGRKKILILTAAVLALVALLVFAWPVVLRFVSSFLLKEGSSLGRLDIWKGALEIFLRNPLLGVGLGNYPREIDALVAYRNPITSHNLYLDIASETGIFGIAAWLLLIFGSMRIAQIHANCAHANNRALAIGVFGSLAYFSVHSFFETAIFNPIILATLMLVLALASVLNKNEHLA